MVYHFQQYTPQAIKEKTATTGYVRIDSEEVTTSISSQIVALLLYKLEYRLQHHFLQHLAQNQPPDSHRCEHRRSQSTIILCNEIFSCQSVSSLHEFLVKEAFKLGKI